MENDDYTIFSDKVHAKGFLRLYTEFLNLNSEELLALWRREYEKYFDSKKVSTIGTTSKTYQYPKIFITPTLILVLIIFSAVVSFFGYLFFQYRNYTGAPTYDSLQSKREHCCR
jgi:cytoskeletal protein RodZ